jgi:hypothetical protein
LRFFRKSRFGNHPELARAAKNLSLPSRFLQCGESPLVVEVWLLLLRLTAAHRDLQASGLRQSWPPTRLKPPSLSPIIVRRRGLQEHPRPRRRALGQSERTSGRQRRTRSDFSPTFIPRPSHLDEAAAIQAAQRNRAELSECSGPSFRYSRSSRRQPPGLCCGQEVTLSPETILETVGAASALIQLNERRAENAWKGHPRPLGRSAPCDGHAAKRAHDTSVREETIGRKTA